MNAKRWPRAGGLGKRSACAALAIVAATVFAGCAGTTPELGGGGTVATGGAGGATSVNANSQLEKCSQSLGTLAVVEDQNTPWYRTLTQYRLGSTVPVLRMMIQQSNCFVIVERGAAMNNLMQERALQSSGELRTGSSFQKGQIVAADYTMSPSIAFSQKGTSGVGGGLGGFGGFGAVAGLVAGGLKSNEAATTLLMVDNRSGVQLAAAVGSAQNYDFNVLGAGFGFGGGGGGGGALGGYSNTPEGKILIASFMDSYNQIVRATRNYTAQEVKGGLGTGGTLAVQGGQTPASGPMPTAIMSNAEAQRRLAQLGFDPGPPDGVAGARTTAAIRAFQKERGLDMNGRIDAPTSAQLMK